MVLVLLAGCGGDDPPAGIAVRDVTVESTAVGRDMAVKVVVPEGGGAKRPLLVFLHGRGNDEGSYVHEPMLAALKALGRDAPIVAFPDGAEESTGTTARAATGGRYVVREVIPQVARRFGADRRRVAIGGVSMRRWPGGHDGDCWDAHWRDYLRFYARGLRRC
jgi:poly(3-hydroxybutyrate) depolymerase